MQQAEGCLPLGVSCIELCSMFQKPLHGLELALLHRKVQRRLAVAIPHVDICTMRQEQFRDVGIASPQRPFVEYAPRAVRFVLDRRTVYEQQLNQFL